jgi:hypothetical protein
MASRRHHLTGSWQEVYAVISITPGDDSMSSYFTPSAEAILRRTRKVSDSINALGDRYACHESKQVKRPDRDERNRHVEERIRMIINNISRSVEP